MASLSTTPPSAPTAPIFSSDDVQTGAFAIPSHFFGIMLDGRCMGFLATEAEALSQVALYRSIVGDTGRVQHVCREGLMPSDLFAAAQALELELRPAPKPRPELRLVAVEDDSIEIEVDLSSRPARHLRLVRDDG